MRPRVKICGLTRTEDVRMCIGHGADIVGFITEYPRPVPWNLSAEQAKTLIAQTAGKAQSCIVTAGGPDHVLRLARQTRPDFVQLHGHETPAETALIARELKEHGIGVIKALSPSRDDPDDAAAYQAAGVWALLLDPRDPERATQGGCWDLAAWTALQTRVSCPLILAGGLSPNNVAQAVRLTGARIIDLMSGVEESPGVKDENRVMGLFQALG